MSWLVTGGAGYIGAHIARAFLAEGIACVAYDDLSTGRREFVPDGAPLVVGSVTDRAALLAAMSEHDVDGVVHLAGRKYAGVSVREPLDYYWDNVEGTRALLAAMAAAGVRRLVFSSSAAVYGTPSTPTVTEDSPLQPESPYGETKLVGEWLCADVARAAQLDAADPLAWVALRYFNVVGSGPDGVYDVSPHNLFPLVLDAVTAGRGPRVLGTDYDTPDGTAVRDYLHVQDVAEAHVAAARALAAGPLPRTAYNLGRGQGLSVREVVDALLAASPVPVHEPELGPRRPGDPASIVALPLAAQRDLGWVASRGLDEMTESAWRAWRRAGELGDARLG